MTQLSDRDLRLALHHRDFNVEPYPSAEQFQPCSIDLKLGSSFRRKGEPAVIMDSYLLPPLRFVLATTQEVVTMGIRHCARVEGKSTNARDGLLVEAAGLVDPGFGGQVTLECFNMSDEAIRLTKGMYIAQLSVFKLSSPTLLKYGDPTLNSHYQGQRGATEAKRG